jgi:hypothetical protein
LRFLEKRKIIKFQPGRKTVLSDKAVVKKHDLMGYLPDWTGLPGVTREVKTVDEFKGMSDAVSLCEVFEAFRSKALRKEITWFTGFEDD